MNDFRSYNESALIIAIPCLINKNGSVMSEVDINDYLTSYPLTTVYSGTYERTSNFLILFREDGTKDSYFIKSGELHAAWIKDKSSYYKEWKQLIETK